MNITRKSVDILNRNIKKLQDEIDNDMIILKEIQDKCDHVFKDGEGVGFGYYKSKCSICDYEEIRG